MTLDGQALEDDGTTHTCKNCGSRVSADYVRVFAPDDLEDERKVRACPRCGVVRKPRGGVRQARSAGSGGTKSHEARPDGAERSNNSGYERGGEADGSA